MLREAAADAILERISSQLPYNSTPFFIVDLCTAKNVHKQWQELLPDVQPYYAVKTNNNSRLLKAFADHGTCFDCASVNEMSQVLSLGVPPDRIILANPVKSPEALLFAKKHDVRLMTFDNADELVKIKKLCPSAKVVLRIFAEDGGEAATSLSTKFGARPEDCKVLLKLASCLSLDCVGVSFHVGSGINKAEPYLQAVEAASKTMAFGRQLDLTMNLLDIGGGFVPDSFPDIAPLVHAALQDYFPAERKVQFVAEPGRLFSRDAFILTCCVIGRRGGDRRKQPVDLYQTDGVFQSFANVPFEKAVICPKFLVRPCQNSRPDLIALQPGDYHYNIWGPSCDGSDKVVTDFACHVKVEVGDWLVYEGMGAYSLTCAMDFNGMDRPEIASICS